jgi:hypothetical protein
MLCIHTNESIFGLAFLLLLCICATAEKALKRMEPATEFDYGGAQCNVTDQCGGIHQGECSYGVCVCTEDFAGANCQHLRKSRLTAFLLSFFLGMYGADRFYLGDVAKGVVKLLLNLTSCCALLPLVCGMNTAVRVSGQESEMVTCCFVSIGVCCCGVWLLGTGIWWLVDWCLIVNYALTDADGYSLVDDF